MAWPEPVKNEVLVKCGRHCCICHKFCGVNIELHHIVHKSEKGLNTLENCIPLCFDCHAAQTSYDHSHPKGTKYSREELKMHRDKWFQMASQNLGTGSGDRLDLDIQFFKRMYGMIPNEYINILKNLDFNQNRFNIIYFNQFFGLLKYCNKHPYLEFYDSDLASLFNQLKYQISVLESEINLNTYQANTKISGVQCVPVEWLDTDPERYFKVVDKLNSTATSLYNLYVEFVSTARYKLGVVVG